MPPESSRLFEEAQAHHQAGRLAEAAARYEEVLAAKPRHGGALHMLGLIAFQTGDTQAALARLTQAVKADPDVPSLHANLGLVLTAMGQLREAEAAHLTALRLRPGDAHVLSALAALALVRGDGDTALARATAALQAGETPATRRLFADIAGAMRLERDEPVLRRLLTRALAESWGPLVPLARAASGLIAARLATGGSLESDALLRAALPAAPITDAALEDALTAARRALLGSGGNAGFAAALAQQCFLNGYIFWEDEAETAQVAALRDRVEAAGPRATDIDVATLACYLPLHTIPGADRIAASTVLAPLLQQQLGEPAQEQRLAAALPALTPVDADESDAAPWPRWSGRPAADAPVLLRDYLAGRFPTADLSQVPQTPDMLVAGCGTGQYALHLAATLTVGETIALDLSRANLAYAARKAHEAGVQLTFGVGDITCAAALGRRFGLIECGGVLHQLPDPLAGWAALLAVLEPGGVMRIAVHSKAAQAQFADVRARIARQEFSQTPQGIRAARQWLKQQNDTSLAPVLDAAAFFTDGGCRHLLFADSEQPLSFGDIAAFLAAHGLVLLGLEAGAETLAAYRARFPADPAAIDLDNWAAFEQDTPGTFAAMIQFWVASRG